MIGGMTCPLTRVPLTELVRAAETGGFFNHRIWRWRWLAVEPVPDIFRGQLAWHTWSGPNAAQRLWGACQAGGTVAGAIWPARALTAVYEL